MASVWAELQRRNVVKVAVAYAIVAWLSAQLAEFATATFGAPDWVLQTFVVFLILGLPLALILAWAYEMTPEGIKAAADVQPIESITHTTGQRLNYVILGLVVLAVAFLIIDQYLIENVPAARMVQGADASSDRSPSSLGVKRAVITLEEGNQLALAELAPLGVGRRSLALSPDGTYLTYVVDRGNVSQLYLRRMDEFEARALEGTEGAFGPFFSPDGQWIGFLTESQIMKVSIRGGTPQALADAGNVYGATWGPDDTIVFAEREGLQLSMVSASGGEKQVLRTGNWGGGDPEFLPDGTGVLVTDADGIIIFVPETGETIRLIEGGKAPHYVPTGHIVYTDDGGVLAVPFDLSTLALTGPAVPVLNGVRRERNGVAQLTFSTDGWLAYIPGVDMRNSTPVWVDRSGSEEPIPLPPQRYGTFRLSPDGSQVALLIDGLARDIWLFDFHRATAPRRLTVGGHKDAPTWSPDGQYVVFEGDDPSGQEGGIFKQRSDGGGSVLPVVTAEHGFNDPVFWATGDRIAFGAAGDIWVIRPGEGAEREPFVGTSAHEWGPSISPDGRFVAYTSDESGQYQVYVKSYPPTEARWTISVGYGEEPVWSRMGDEIFYRRGNEWLSVPVETGPDFETGIPRLIFEGPYVNVPGFSYDVAPDAQRFLVLKQPEGPPATGIHVVANWFEELKRLAPPAE